MPGRGNRQRDQEAAQRMERFPNSAVQQLPGDGEIKQCSPDRKDYADQALEQQAGSQACRQDYGP